MNKKEFLDEPVEHVDITSFDARPIIEAMGAHVLHRPGDRPRRRHASAMVERPGLQHHPDHRRLHQRGGLHGACTRTWCATTWSTRSSPPAPRSWTWTSSRPWASGTTRAPPTWTTRSCGALHRPHLRHLHRRGASCRPATRRSRRSPTAWAPAVLLAGVHPGDGQLPERRQRQEEGQPGPDRLRAGRADLLPGLLRLQRRLRPGAAPERAAQGARVHRLGARTSAS